MSPTPAVLTAIASPRRCEMLRLLWNEELTAGAIHRAMPDVTFGAVSLQLRTLAEAGLVESRAEKQSRLYKARREALGPLAQMLEQMWDDALWRLKLEAELEETRRGPRPSRGADGRVWPSARTHSTSGWAPKPMARPTGSRRKKK